MSGEYQELLVMLFNTVLIKYYKINRGKVQVW